MGVRVVESQRSAELAVLRNSPNGEHIVRGVGDCVGTILAVNRCGNGLVLGIIRGGAGRDQGTRVEPDDQRVTVHRHSFSLTDRGVHQFERRAVGLLTGGDAEQLVRRHVPGCEQPAVVRSHH